MGKQKKGGYCEIRIKRIVKHSSSGQGVLVSLVHPDVTDWFPTEQVSFVTRDYADPEYGKRVMVVPRWLYDKIHTTSQSAGYPDEAPF